MKEKKRKPEKQMQQEKQKAPTIEKPATDIPERKDESTPKQEGNSTPVQEGNSIHEQEGNSIHEQEGCAKSDLSDQSDQSDIIETSQDHNLSENSDNSDNSEYSENSDHSDNSDHSHHSDHPLEFPDNIEIADDDRQALTEMATTLAQEIGKGMLSEKTTAMMLHALHYERDIANAAREGEIKGRNIRIDEYLIQRKKATSIHQPGNSAQTQRPTLPYSRIGGLSAADRQTIWERGNEKRVRY